MYEKAVISNVANAGIVICEPLKLVCNNEAQFSKADFETHIVGLSFATFFLTHSGRSGKIDPSASAVENIYICMLSGPPTYLRAIFRGQRYRESQDARYRQAYTLRRGSYQRLFLTCLSSRMNFVDNVFHERPNGPGSDLFQEMLRNVFQSNVNLRRPNDREMIKASHNCFEAVLFVYNFLDQNWEELVVNR